MTSAPPRSWTYCDNRSICGGESASAGTLFNTTIAGPSHAALSVGRLAGWICIHPRGDESPTHHRCDAIGADGRIESASFSGHESPGESRAVIGSIVVTRCVDKTVDPVGAVALWRC